MNKSTGRELRSCTVLTAAAVIWGFAFVALRVGASEVPPFALNGLKFSLAAVTLLPFLIFSVLHSGRFPTERMRHVLFSGSAVGVVLFLASTFQQLGISAGCTAGKSGFIASLYIVLVPVLGVCLGRRPPANAWVSVVIAVAGVYLISVRENFTMSPADLLVLLSAFFWAVHILLTDRYSKNTNPFILAFAQFSVCAVLSLGVSVFHETVTLRGVLHASVPLLYSGVLSSGVGISLQNIAQRHIRPAHGAVIMSMESLFAAIGGYLILGERLGLRGFAGCMLVFSAALLSQFSALRQGAYEKNRP